MNIQPTNQQPISDDQELAKVLAGINQQVDSTTSTQNIPDEVALEETPVADPVVAMAPLPEMEQPMMSVAPVGNLDSIKQAALGELRPLVDKLNVSPEEKFDTYLLLLRSTDDQSLISPAHEAARSISDEARRAQALLDIIKEIDYLSNPHATA